MTKLPKAASIYNIIYALISFLGIVFFGLFVVASRGILLFSPFIVIPFFVGFLYFVGLILAILAYRSDNSQPKLKNWLRAFLVIYGLEALALLLPLLRLASWVSDSFAAVVIPGAIFSVPVTKICLLICSVVVLVKGRRGSVKSK